MDYVERNDHLADQIQSKTSLDAAGQLGRQEERHHKLMMLKKKMDRCPEDTLRD
jgi:hypothetical protein